MISSATEAAGQGVGGVSVQVVSGAVVPAGGAGVGVAGEVLHVAERDTRVQGGGDRRVPQAVRAQLVRGGDARGAGQPADEPPDGGFAEAAAVPVEEDGAGGAAGEVGLQGADGGRGERLDAVFAALAGQAQYPVAEVVGQVGCVRRQGLPPPVAR